MAKAKDWTKIQKKYGGLWVALDQDEETVLTVGKTLKQALDAARNKGYQHPIMTRMPETLDVFIGIL